MTRFLGLGTGMIQSHKFEDRPCTLLYVIHVLYFFNLFFSICSTECLFPISGVAAIEVAYTLTIEVGRAVRELSSSGGVAARALCAGLPAMDGPLLTVLVGHWRLETHSFHLPCGELSITLQNVAMILHMHLEGNAITGIIQTEGRRDSGGSYWR